MSVLAFSGFGVRYGAHTALVDLDLAVEAGEIVALIGETGSGKSSAALAALGLLPRGTHTQGRVERNGRLAMIFQDPQAALNPLQTIGAQVAEAVRIHQPLSGAAALTAAARLLAETGLDPARVPPSRYPHELSGGQRQRVCIAMALACQPDLLVADEPTSALDAATQAQVMALLVDLVRGRGMALLLITHDLLLARGVADRIALLQGGRLKESGPLPQVLEQPATRALLAHVSHMAIRNPATTPAAATPVLEVRGLTHGYGSHKVLDGIDLTVTAGEIVGLVGGSGEGKSTLLRLVLGLEQPQQGVALVQGIDLLHARGTALRAARRQVQAVFQDPGGSLDPRWPVWRSVAEPLHLLDERLSAAERRDRAIAALARVNLPADTADRLPNQFSGGQRQRIALARALVIEPALVVLDEATSALDAAVRAGILDLLAALADDGLALLFVTHDQAMIAGLADRVFSLKQGRLHLQPHDTPRAQ
ncbi:ATP-binding cassette domain-containing protein [Novosphingobium sp. FKTRR1]|uniref:ATP-binding cassette domain-containing protein n=1 Tax=Novosphingobium sp. FKTRR1 TaxID=2879118 RepID=UPI001CF0C42B